MGPLSGIRVIEIAGLAPAPFGCMILADLGAEVVRIDRATARDRGLTPPAGPLDRGRETIALDLKSERGVTALHRLAEAADVFVEGFRPGVAERLGIGPAELLARNPGLVYARMTGWGQDGPLASRAGHDINYIALAGALEPIGRAGERPVPPLNLLGDFAGGGMLMALGVLAALHEKNRSGKGQVVDAAMVDGAALLTTFIHGLRNAGLWQGERGTNLFDGAAPFYDTYETADGKHVAVGCVEVEFFTEMTARLGLAEVPDPYDFARWDELRRALTAAFKERTRDEWAEIFADSDGCVTPVLTPWEAHAHPHNRARGAFVEVDGVTQPAPAPRFSRTPTAPPLPPGARGAAAVLATWGLEPNEIDRVLAAGS